jgi:hypothetical protein
MQISYELTERDFRQAYVAHRNRSALRKWARRVFICSVCLGAAFVLFGFLLKPSAQAAKDLLPLFGWVVMWIAILWGLPVWTMRRQFLKHPGAHGARTVTLDPSGVHWRWSGGTSDVEWKNYIRSVQGDNQILFYTSPACFNIIPKRALEGSKPDEVREILQQNIPSSK